MAATNLATTREIKIDGLLLKDVGQDHLETVVVHDRLAMPDTFSIIFRDPTRDILSKAGLEIGKKVKISTAFGSDALKPLIDGEITSIEADYDALGARALVRGYDLSHRLNAGRKTKTFVNAKVSDVASQLASAAGLQAEVDDSGKTIDHLFQANLSDLDFLYAQARRINYDLHVDGQKLYFKKRPNPSSAPAPGEVGSKNPLTLVWSQSLLEFRASVSAVAQVKEVKVRGWDVQKKEDVVGQANVSHTHIKLTNDQSSAALAATSHGQTLFVVDQPVGTQEDAAILARAKAEQVGDAAFEATALAVGSPDLRAGVAVSISGVGAAFEGKYMISSSRHEFGAVPYRTQLEFSGPLDRSLLGLVANALPGSAGQRARIQGGVAVAVVTENKIEKGLCRVKLRYPWLTEADQSFWARLAAPGAGKDRGVVWIPEVHDEVLVVFEHGDINFPVVVGGLWNGQDLAPIDAKLLDNGTATRREFTSRKGHKFTFHDKEDDSGISMITKKGEYEISLDDTKNELHIKALKGKLVIEADSVEIKATKELKLSGTSASVEASGQMKIKGATVALN